MIRLEDLTKTFGGRVAVDHLDLEVPEGELCVLVGPSGCGKTTTLRMVNRLVEPTSGRILLDGQDVTAVDVVRLRRRIGYVIQHVGLFPHQSIADNVATVPRLLGWSRDRVDARVHELLGLVGLDPDQFARRYPHELSGGQRQRVGVARALGADPPVLLMDEPFGAIDPVTRGRLQQEFVNLQDELRKTVVFVTHDVEEAVRLGDRIAILRQGGVLEQYDTPAEVLAHPASPFVADFLGADRGLTRLGVVSVTEADLRRPPVLASSDTLAAARRSLAELVESAASHNIAIGLESRLHFHEIPSAEEAMALLEDYPPEQAGYWHDVGHWEVQGRLRLIDPRRWLSLVAPRMIGTHLHDVRGITDHRAPGNGDVDWSYIAAAVPPHAARTFEIDQHEPVNLLAAAISFLARQGVLARTER